MKSKDTYEEPQQIESQGAIIRIYRPILEEAERERRMKSIRKAAENMMKGGMQSAVHPG